MTGWDGGWREKNGRFVRSAKFGRVCKTHLNVVTLPLLKKVFLVSTPTVRQRVGKCSILPTHFWTTF